MVILAFIHNIDRIHKIMMLFCRDVIFSYLKYSYVVDFRHIALTFLYVIIRFIEWGYRLFPGHLRL
jgi:hypothetical protein